MPDTATLSIKYQISIPKAIREAMHWYAGQEFVFIQKGEGVLVIPVPELNQLKGIAVTIVVALAAGYITGKILSAFGRKALVYVDSDEFADAEA